MGFRTRVQLPPGPLNTESELDEEFGFCAFKGMETSKLWEGFWRFLDIDYDLLITDFHTQSPTTD